MKEVDQSIIDIFLNLYNPDLRYLKKESVDLDNRIGYATLEVPENNIFASNGKRSPHVTESETQIMITQMMWPFYAELLNGPGIEDLKLTYNDFFAIAKHGIFLIEEKKIYTHHLSSKHGIEGIIKLSNVIKKPTRDGSHLWITDVHTEVYPPKEYREHETYNSFEAKLLLKPSMAKGHNSNE